MAWHFLAAVQWQQSPRTQHSRRTTVHSPDRADVARSLEAKHGTWPSNRIPKNSCWWIHYNWVWRSNSGEQLVFAHTGEGKGIFVCATTHSSEGVKLHSFLITAINWGERKAGTKSWDKKLGQRAGTKSWDKELYTILKFSTPFTVYVTAQFSNYTNQCTVPKQYIY
jgi:hypothetical protein